MKLGIIKYIYISWANYDAVTVGRDETVEKIIDGEILHGCTSVGDIEYINEYSVKIDTNRDYDLREALFGGLKEVNNRWCYHIWDIRKFQESANEVAKECVKKLEESASYKKHMQRYKTAFINELVKVTGIAENASK